MSRITITLSALIFTVAIGVLGDAAYAQRRVAAGSFAVDPPIIKDRVRDNGLGYRRPATAATTYPCGFCTLLSNRFRGIIDIQTVDGKTAVGWDTGYDRILSISTDRLDIAARRVDLILSVHRDENPVRASILRLSVDLSAGEPHLKQEELLSRENTCWAGASIVGRALYLVDLKMMQALRFYDLDGGGFYVAEDLDFRIRCTRQSTNAGCYQGYKPPLSPSLWLRAPVSPPRTVFDYGRHGGPSGGSMGFSTFCESDFGDVALATTKDRSRSRNGQGNTREAIPTHVMVRFRDRGFTPFALALPRDMPEFAETPIAGLRTLKIVGGSGMQKFQIRQSGEDGEIVDLSELEMPRGGLQTVELRRPVGQRSAIWIEVARQGNILRPRATGPVIPENTLRARIDDVTPFWRAGSQQEIRHEGIPKGARISWVYGEVRRELRVLEYLDDRCIVWLSGPPPERGQLSTWKAVRADLGQLEIRDPEGERVIATPIRVPWLKRADEEARKLK